MKNFINLCKVIYLLSVNRILIVLICIIYFENVNAQAKAFSDKDLKKIRESEIIKSKANEEQYKTNEIYQRMAILSQEENFQTDKSLIKEYKNLEEKARKIEMKSAELYGESNKIQWYIYKKYIEDFWNTFKSDKNQLINALLLEEKGFEFIYRAASMRESARKNTAPDEIIPKLTEAYELEIMGLEKLKMAYTIYKSWPEVLDAENTTVAQEQIKDPTVNYIDDGLTSSTSYQNITNDTVDIFSSNNISEFKNKRPVKFVPGIDKVEVDQERIRRFQDYINNHINDSLNALQNYISGYDMESVIQFWNIYKNQTFDSDIRVIQDQNRIDTSAFLSSNFQSQTQSFAHTGTIENTETDFTGRNEQKTGFETDKSSQEDYSELIYRVQIAQNKTPLSQGLLQKAYIGNYIIKLIQEDGWYKYSIGDFNSYNEADSFRNKLNIKEAFVIAYKKEMNFQNITDNFATTVSSSPSLISVDTRNQNVWDENKSYDNQFETYVTDDEKIIFVVQIAASRVPMSKTLISNLYIGQEKILLRHEENWYKYQIGYTNSYEDAKKILKSVKVHGAFIAAYKGNEKQKLWEAIRMTHEASNQIVFKIQIAASKSKLDDEKIKKIYQGNDRVEEILEEGMYKYQITAGNSYEAARRLRNLLGIKGSFVVPYRNQEKLGIKEAIELTK